MHGGIPSILTCDSSKVTILNLVYITVNRKKCLTYSSKPWKTVNLEKPNLVPLVLNLPGDWRKNLAKS